VSPGGDSPAGAAPARVLLLTIAALFAFAGNSILCRLALGEGSIDAASFATLRLGSGALVLWLLLRFRGARPAGSWAGGLALALYAVPFTFAYLLLGAGTGALVLFGCVQAIMIAAGLREGERPRGREWSGLLLALGGLVYLVAPGLTAPAPLGSILMALAGSAWAAYSLLGRNAASPVAATAGNFLRSLPVTLLVSLGSLRSAHLSPRGALLAVVSGAITSGLGYVIWYAALRGLTATRAATAQLAVPALTAVGGVLLLGEPVTVRLVLAALLILGGIALALHGRR
jgi:drug/metabolite transporter (DMT)-like permease